MRSCCLTLLVVAGLASSAVQARGRPSPPRSRSARTVELIVMTPLGQRGSSEPFATAGLFETHDLGQRSVEHRMRAAADEPVVAASSASVEANDPLILHDGAATGSMLADPVLGPAAAIPVPDWMTSARVPPLAGRFVPGCSPAPYRPTGFLKFSAEARRLGFYATMSSAACEHGLPIGLFDAMIIRESRYDPTSLSPKNAYGLTQLMPATAAGLGVDRYDVAANLRGGASYLRQQLDRFGQVHLALAAYNAGPGRVRKAVPAIAETRAYVDAILRDWSRLSGFEGQASRRGLPSRPMNAVVAERTATLLTF